MIAGHIIAAAVVVIAIVDRVRLKAKLATAEVKASITAANFVASLRAAAAKRVSDAKAAVAADVSKVEGVVSADVTRAVKLVGIDEAFRLAGEKKK